MPPYTFNYKIPELTYTLVSAAGLVAFSKVARLVNSTVESERNTGLQLFTYLHRLQIWGSMCMAIVYVFLNDKFIELWLGEEYRVSVYLQLAFAANLVFAAAGDAPIRGVSMFSSANLPYFGRVLFGMGALNLGLSLLFMKLGSLIGIAIATVVAQGGLNCFLIVRLARHKGADSRALLVRTLIQPLMFVVVLFGLKLFWRVETVLGQLSLGAAAVSLVILQFYLLGLRPDQAAAEYNHLLRLLKPPVPEKTTTSSQGNA